MTLLSRKLQEIRSQHSAQYGTAQSQILELGAQLRQQDEQLIADLDDILEGHAERRAILHRKIITVAQCAGLLPPPAPQQAEPPMAIEGTEVSTAPPEEAMPRVLRNAARPAPGSGVPAVARH